MIWSHDSASSGYAPQPLGIVPLDGAMCPVIGGEYSIERVERRKLFIDVPMNESVRIFPLHISLTFATGLLV
jgi:hypothetical protein